MGRKLLTAQINHILKSLLERQTAQTLAGEHHPVGVVVHENHMPRLGLQMTDQLKILFKIILDIESGYLEIAERILDRAQSLRIGKGAVPLRGKTLDILFSHAAQYHRNIPPVLGTGIAVYQPGLQPVQHHHYRFFGIRGKQVLHPLLPFFHLPGGVHVHVFHRDTVIDPGAEIFGESQNGLHAAFTQGRIRTDDQHRAFGIGHVLVALVRPFHQGGIPVGNRKGGRIHPG